MLCVTRHSRQHELGIIRIGNPNINLYVHRIAEGPCRPRNDDGNVDADDDEAGSEDDDGDTDGSVSYVLPLVAIGHSLLLVAAVVHLPFLSKW